MKTAKIFASAFGIVSCLLVGAREANALDINGAWTTDEKMRSKIFLKRGIKISMPKDADIYGSGFVIEGDQIRGKIAT